jgi:hypothetical protein
LYDRTCTASVWTTTNFLGADCLEDIYDETIMEIGWEVQDCHHAGSLQARLRGEELKFMSYRLRSANRIETAYQHKRL